MKLTKLFLILGIALVSIGGAMFIAGVILTLLTNSLLGDIFMGISSLFGIAALVLLILRLIYMAKNPENYPEYIEEPKVFVKEVDVKDIPKTKEEELFEQYEDLYKKGLISEEGLEQKRVELLGK